LTSSTAFSLPNGEAISGFPAFAPVSRFCVDSPVIVHIGMVVRLGTPGRVGPSCAVSSRVGQFCGNGGHGEVVVISFSGCCCVVALLLYESRERLLALQVGCRKSPRRRFSEGARPPTDQTLAPLHCAEFVANCLLGRLSIVISQTSVGLDVGADGIPNPNINLSRRLAMTTSKLCDEGRNNE
jgi:hypothetical protein